MALTTCDYCGKTLLSAAANCPQCGITLDGTHSDDRPEPAGTCPYCSGSVRKIKGLQGAREFAIFFVLFCLGLFPGLLYYMWAENTAYCLHCSRRVRRLQPD
jgi:hypothetical protein